MNPLLLELLLPFGAFVGVAAFVRWAIDHERARELAHGLQAVPVEIAFDVARCEYCGA